MATTANFVGVNEQTTKTKNGGPLQNIYLHRLLTQRRTPAIQSNKGLITAFAIMCSFLFMITYLETSRMLIPTRVVSKRDLRTLTSGFTNDLPIKDSKDESSWINHLMPHPHRPKALFVGFSHCGGKSILSVLGSHPGITVNKKEMKYFTGNVSKRWYLSHQPPSLNHHVTIDICCSCITNRTALSKVKAFNETIKIVVVVCDPISRLLATYAKRIDSHGKHQVNHCKTTDHNSYDFESLKSKIFVKFSLLNNMNAQLLAEIGDYFRYLVDIYQIFSKDQVLVIERDKFRTNFISELHRLHNFLGVPLEDKLRELSYDVTRDVMCYRFNSVTRTCLTVRSQNLTQVFATEAALLKSLKQFYRPFSRRLFLYLDNKFDWY